MSEQEPRDEQTPDPIGEQGADWEEQLNAATAAIYERDEQLPDEEDAPTEPSEEAPPEDDAPPQEPSQTEEPLDEYEQRLARYLRQNTDVADTLVAIQRGEMVALPREVVQAVNEFRSQRSEPAQEPSDDTDDDIYADPFAVIRELRQWKAQTEAERQQQAAAYQEQQNRENWQLLTNIGAEWESTKADTGIAVEEIRSRVVNTIANTSILPAFLKRYPGDKPRAVREAFEAAFRIEFPEAAQAAVVNKQIRDNRRARRAGATAASPRSVQRTREEPKTRTDRVAALADDLREAMQANA